MSAAPLTAYELGHVFTSGMSTYQAVPPFLRLDVNRHGDRVVGDDVSIASDVLVASPHCGTHIDALAHVCDAREEPVTDRPFGEALPALSARGRLADVSRVVAERGPVVGRDDLLATLGDEEIAAGDVVLVRTGWEAELTEQSGRYGTDMAAMPGLDLDAAAHLAESGVLAVGADTPTLEPAATGFAVHRLLLQERGVHIIENLRLSALAAAGVTTFLFLALPLRVQGATGSPIRPLALTGPDALKALMVGTLAPEGAST